MKGNKKKPQLAKLSRKQLPNGLLQREFENGRCELGPFRTSWLGADRKYKAQNCDKPAVRQIAGIFICQECSDRIDGIVADARAFASSGRHPLIAKPYGVLKRAG